MATYDDAKKYTVKLTRVVQRGPKRFLPGSEIEMKGSFLKKLIEQDGEEIIDHARES